MNMKTVIAGLIILVLAGLGYFLVQNHIKPTQTHLSRVTIDHHTFAVEVATTSAQLELGLSNRTSLSQDHGMLFAFPVKGDYTFWMRNMRFPLDIIFIDTDKLVSIKQNAPPLDDTHKPVIYQPEKPANYVLEINAGLAQKFNFKLGDTVKIER